MLWISRREDFPIFFFLSQHHIANASYHHCFDLRYFQIFPLTLFCVKFWHFRYSSFVCCSIIGTEIMVWFLSQNIAIIRIIITTQTVQGRPIQGRRYLEGWILKYKMSQSIPINWNFSIAKFPIWSSWSLMHLHTLTFLMLIFFAILSNTCKLLRGFFSEISF